LKYIKIVFAILLAIVGILHITGVWDMPMPIMLLLLSILNISNARDSYNNNRKIEAVVFFIGGILIGLIVIYKLLF